MSALYLMRKPPAHRVLTHAGRVWIGLLAFSALCWTGLYLALSSWSAALPVTAPRGKVFAVVRMNHVIGGKVLPVIKGSGWKARADAERFAKAIDERLSPTLCLIDEPRVEEVS